MSLLLVSLKRRTLVQEKHYSSSSSISIHLRILNTATAHCHSKILRSFVRFYLQKVVTEDFENFRIIDLNFRMDLVLKKDFYFINENYKMSILTNSIHRIHTQLIFITHRNEVICKCYVIVFTIDTKRGIRRIKIKYRIY